MHAVKSSAKINLTSGGIKKNARNSSMVGHSHDGKKSHLCATAVNKSQLNRPNGLIKVNDSSEGIMSNVQLLRETKVTSAMTSPLNIAASRDMRLSRHQSQQERYHGTTYATSSRNLYAT
jgi:hypothetical protein